MNAIEFDVVQETFLGPLGEQIRRHDRIQFLPDQAKVNLFRGDKVLITRTGVSHAFDYNETFRVVSALEGTVVKAVQKEKSFPSVVDGAKAIQVKIVNGKDAGNKGVLTGGYSSNGMFTVLLPDGTVKGFHGKDIQFWK